MSKAINRQVDENQSIHACSATGVVNDRENVLPHKAQEVTARSAQSNPPNKTNHNIVTGKTQTSPSVALATPPSSTQNSTIPTRPPHHLSKLPLNLSTVEGKRMQTEPRHPHERGKETESYRPSAEIVNAPAKNPFDSLCATTVVSDGDSDEDGEECDADHMRRAIQNGSHDSCNAHCMVNPKPMQRSMRRRSSLTRSGSRKCLPASLYSPACLSMRLAPSAPHGTVQPRVRRKASAGGGVTYPEDELSVFRGLTEPAHGADSSMEESIVFCPFRLVGSCVKGQHTERELLSNYTIHSHLMSLAGLVHEMHTEQRIAQKEFQQMQMCVEMQRETIARLERSLAQRQTPHYPDVAAPKPHTMTERMGIDANGSTSRSILKTPTDRPNPEEHEEHATFAQRMRRRTSAAAMTFVACDPNAAKAEPRHHHSVLREAPHGKRMAEDVTSPTDGLLDSAHSHSPRRDAPTADDAARAAICRGPSLDALVEDLVSPISSAGGSSSHGEEEAVVVRALGRGVPQPPSPTRPSLRERRTRSSTSMPVAHRQTPNTDVTHAMGGRGRRHAREAQDAQRSNKTALARPFQSVGSEMRSSLSQRDNLVHIPHQETRDETYERGKGSKGIQSNASTTGQ